MTSDYDWKVSNIPDWSVPFECQWCGVIAMNGRLCDKCDQQKKSDQAARQKSQSLSTWPQSMHPIKDGQ